MAITSNMFRAARNAYGGTVPTFGQFIAERLAAQPTTTQAGGTALVSGAMAGIPTQEGVTAAYGNAVTPALQAPTQEQINNTYGQAPAAVTPTVTPAPTQEAVTAAYGDTVTPTAAPAPTQTEDAVAAAYGNGNGNATPTSTPTPTDTQNNADAAYAPVPAATSAPRSTAITPTSAPRSTAITPTQAQIAAYGGQSSTERLLDQKLAAAYGNAEEARKKAIIDARSNRAIMEAAYGRNAEALAGAGLAGSGVSDYIGAQAYASERDAVAAAYEAEAKAKDAADSAYYDAKIAYGEQQAAKEEANKAKMDAAFITLMNSAKSGAYTAAEIRDMAAKSGLTDETDIGTLASIAETAYAKGETEKAETETAATNKTYISVLDLAKKGTYTADEIRDIAARMGVTSTEDIEKLASAADTAYTKTQTEKRETETEADTAAQNQAFLTLMDSAKSGGYTPDEIREAAARMGVTNAEDVEKLVTIATEAKAKKDKADAEVAYRDVYESGKITSDTSDAEIDKLIADGTITAAQREQAIKDRDAEVEYDFKQIANQNGAEAAYKWLDRQYTAGRYSKAEYQETYYNTVVAELDGMDGSAQSIAAMRDKIGKYAKEGKLTAADAENLFGHMNRYFALDRGKYSVSTNKNTIGKSASDGIITIGDKNYNFTLSKIDNNSVALLDKITQNTPRKLGTLVKMDDTIYIYLADGWKAIRKSGIISGISNSNLFAAYDRAMASQAGTGVPAHVTE